MDLFSLVIVLFLAATAIVSSIVLRSNSSQGKKGNLPPGPYPFPVVGNIFQLTGPPHESITALSKTYGPLMSLHLGRLYTIVISSPEIARELVQKHDIVASNRTIPAATEPHDVHKHTLGFLPVGKKWRNLRKICKEQMFSTLCLEAGRGLRQEKMQKMCDYVKKCSETGRVVNINEAAFITTLNLISATFFSAELTSFDSDATQEFKDVVEDMFKIFGLPNFADYFPILKPFDPQGIKGMAQVTLGKLLAMMEDQILKPFDTLIFCLYYQSTMANYQVPLSTSSRPLANFHPSVWGDRFLHFHESKNNNRVREEDQMVEQLKEEVKWMLKKAISKDYIEQLEIVDAIQRLGIAYHFGEEIDQVLQDVFEKFDDYCKSNLNLYNVALSFRLLRQHGYRVSSEIFEKFKDVKGAWIVPNIEPAKGILELFDATHLRVHNEDVLDDAFVFSREYLNLALPSLDSPYDELVHRALKENSYRRGFPRLEARHYISIYGKFASHTQTLLRFAKLDFNKLQSMHKKELSEISRWWKDLDIKTNFPYARDRLPECYLWALAAYFEPEYAFGRIILCKVAALITLVDDTFDAYGTFEELKLFNEATERWDISCLDQLPDYMKLLYEAVLCVFAELKEEMTKLGALYRYTYAKEGWIYGVRHYFYEAEWRHKNHIPTIDEYMSIAEGSANFLILITVTFAAMGDLATKEAFEWVFSNPDIMRALNVLGRLKDDIAGHEFERNREHIPSAVECYIEEHKVGKKEAVNEFNNRTEAKWKDINQAFLKPTEVPVPLLDRILNFSRFMEIFYSKGDWFTHVGPETKAIINQTLVDPIPE